MARSEGSRLVRKTARATIRMRSIVLTVLVAVCGLQSAQAQQAGPAPLPLTAEALRDLLVAKSEQVKSFRGDYHLRQDNANGYWFEGQVHQVYSDDNVYLRREWGSNGIRRVETRARRDGTISSLLEEDIQGVRKPPSGAIGLKKWPDPRGGYLTPEEGLGHIYGLRLSKWLADGSLLLRTEEGQAIISHLDAGRQSLIEIACDDSYRPVRITRSILPPDIDARPDENAPVRWDLYVPMAVLDLSEYVKADSVEFPARIARTDFDLNQKAPEYEAWKDEARQGKIGADDLLARVAAHMRGSMKRADVQVLEIDKNTLEVNRPVDPAEFQIHFPDGTVMYDYLTQKSFVLGQDVTKGLNKALDPVAGLWPPGSPSDTNTNAVSETKPSQAAPQARTIPKRTRFPLLPIALLAGVAAGALLVFAFKRVRAKGGRL